MICPSLCSCIATHTFIRQLQLYCCTFLVEWVGSGAPVCEEQAEADSLEDTGQDTNSDGVKRALLSNDLGNDLEIWLEESTLR